MIQAIYPQAVVLNPMPMNNATQITEPERAPLGDGVRAGARLGWRPQSSAAGSANLQRALP
jgi:uncharacterized membrane protein